MRKLKQARYSGLGFLLWFMHNSWKPKALGPWTDHLNETVKRIRQEGFSVVDFFVWTCNGKRGNWYSNNKLPWIRKKRTIYFDEWNDKWWKRFEIFIATLHRWDLEPSLMLFSRYVLWAFKHAAGGAINFWSADALRIQIRFVRKLILVIQKYYGADFMPWLKPNNELRHNGSNETGAMYATWYVNLFDGIQDLFPEKDDVSKYIIDTTFCEWMQFPFAYDESFEFRGYRLGQGRFLRNGKRKYVAEGHKFSCPENMTDGRVDKSLSANFPNSTPQIFHEDCGCGKDKNGELIGKGAGIGQYHVGDADQAFEAQEILHSKYKAKKRSAISGFVPLGCLKRRPILKTKGVYMEFMKVDQLDWERAAAFIAGIKAGRK